MPTSCHAHASILHYPQEHSNTQNMQPTNAKRPHSTKYPTQHSVYLQYTLVPVLPLPQSPRAVSLEPSGTSESGISPDTPRPRPTFPTRSAPTSAAFV